MATVENPYGNTGGIKGENAVVAVAHFKGSRRDLDAKDMVALEEATEPARLAGVDVEYGGIVSLILNQPKAGPQEGVGIVLALGVLLLAFGSFLAAGVPIVVSLVVMAVAYSVIHFGASLWQVHPTAPMVAAMLGLGAGIDYALFVVTRHRRQLADGMEVEASIGRALATSGHAVVFAGGTVVFAICGLWFSGIAFIGIIGLASAIAVALMVAGALTLLPAVLAALGTKIDRYRLPRVRPGQGDRPLGALGPPCGRARLAVRDRRHALPALPRDPGAVPAARHHLRRHAAALQQRTPRVRRDGTRLRAGLVQPVRVVASVPTPKDPPRSDESTKTAKGWTALRAEPGGRLAVSPDTRPAPNPHARRLGEDLRKRFTGMRDVAAVEAPVVAGDSVIVTLVPASAPQSAATADLVRDLREKVIPPVAKRYSGARVYVGGETPAIIDMATIVKQRMPYVVAVVVGVALILLVIAFRSVLVPVKAALMNLLSIGASYGVVVAVFQWGWGIRLLGLDQPMPIVSFVPLFMFALVFGLSMDYEVFLLSRVREEYLRSGDPHESVVKGIGSTARLITSAALIMICVFLSFLGQPDSMVKMMGIGLATAVAVDATVVRLMLVPALMSLLGHANWWFPGRRRPRPITTPPARSEREYESVG